MEHEDATAETRQLMVKFLGEATYGLYPRRNAFLEGFIFAATRTEDFSETNFQDCYRRLRTFLYRDGDRGKLVIARCAFLQPAKEQQELWPAVLETH